MNSLSFVIAAYALDGLATLALVGWSYFAMRGAEADADAVKRRQ